MSTADRLAELATSGKTPAETRAAAFNALAAYGDAGRKTIESLAGGEVALDYRRPQADVHLVEHAPATADGKRIIGLARLSGKADCAGVDFVRN